MRSERAPDGPRHQSAPSGHALAQLRQSIEAFTSRGLAAISTVFVVQPGIPGIERLPALMDIWRATRPVRRADSFEAAWEMVNADPVAAGLSGAVPPSSRAALGPLA